MKPFTIKVNLVSTWEITPNLSYQFQDSNSGPLGFDSSSACTQKYLNILVVKKSCTKAMEFLVQGMNVIINFTDPENVENV